MHFFKLVGNLQCEIGIPSTHLRILNLDCRKVLGCSMDAPIANFGVCCRKRKVVKVKMIQLILTNEN